MRLVALHLRADRPATGRAPGCACCRCPRRRASCRRCSTRRGSSTPVDALDLVVPEAADHAVGVIVPAEAVVLFEVVEVDRLVERVEDEVLVALASPRDAATERRRVQHVEMGAEPVSGVWLAEDVEVRGVERRPHEVVAAVVAVAARRPGCPHCGCRVTSAIPPASLRSARMRSRAWFTVAWGCPGS